MSRPPSSRRPCPPPRPPRRRGRTTRAVTRYVGVSGTCSWLHSGGRTFVLRERTWIALDRATGSGRVLAVETQDDDAAQVLLGEGTAQPRGTVLRRRASRRGSPRPGAARSAGCGWAPDCRRWPRRPARRGRTSRSSGHRRPRYGHRRGPRRRRSAAAGWGRRASSSVRTPGRSSRRSPGSAPWSPCSRARRAERPCRCERTRRRRRPRQRGPRRSGTGGRGGQCRSGGFPGTGGDPSASPGSSRPRPASGPASYASIPPRLPLPGPIAPTACARERYSRPPAQHSPLRTTARPLSSAREVRTRELSTAVDTLWPAAGPSTRTDRTIGRCRAPSGPARSLLLEPVLS